jgi:hypothetical protein
LKTQPLALKLQLADTDVGVKSPAQSRGEVMTEQEKRAADQLLARIETAAGEFPTRDGAHGALLAEIIAATNGLRSLLGVVRAH